MTFGKPGHILFQLSYITITFILLFHIIHVEMSTFIIEGVIKIRGRGQVVCIDDKEKKDDTYTIIYTLSIFSFIYLLSLLIYQCIITNNILID